MISDGKCYLWIPSTLTLSYLTAETAATVNAVHTAIGDPTKRTDYVAGELSPYYFQLNDLDMGGAPFTRDAEPGMAYCGPIENLAYLSPSYAALIVAFGGDIEAFRVFFELTEEQLDTDVPDAFPDRLDDNGDALTWRTWGVFGESHKPVQYGEKWYRSINYGAAGTPLNASHWVGYLNGGGVIKTLAEYLAIQNQE